MKPTIFKGKIFINKKGKKIIYENTNKNII